MHKPLLILSAAFGLFTAAAQAGSLTEIPLKTIAGQETTLAAYKGKVLLAVNVASKCGFTPQYKTLEGLYEKHKAQGLVVLGFPCDQFAHQEPGTAQEIEKFCTGTYGVTFPMFDKLEVNGAGRHPLYQALAGEGSPFPGDIKWNFTKFLVGRDGRILARFDSGVTPDSAELTKAVESALAAK